MPSRCGFYVCLDCYQFRKTGLVKDHSDLKSEDTDEYDWPMCNNAETHVIERLQMAQIIPGSALVEVGRKLHEARVKWNIGQYCHMPEEIDMPYNTEDGILNFRVRM